MSAMDIWLTIAALVVANLSTRCSFFLIGDAVKLPPKIQHALRYAPAAALAALIAPDLILSGGVVDLTWANPKLMASIGAAIYFAVTRQLLGTIVVGMGLFTVLRLVL
jgi:branched-subunit amino acid transport protein